MDEPIENGVRQGGIAEVRVPMVNRQLAGDQGGALAMAIIKEFQEIASVLRVEGR
jgi:hypothetical protein